MALWNSFSYDMKFKMLVRWRRWQCLSPHTASALSDDDVAPVRVLSYQGSHSGRGESPFSA